MHTIQYIAVQADSTDMAFATVKNHLEAELGGHYDNSNAWFDWFVTGGGRWASNEAAQYDDNFMDDVVDQDSPKFQEYLDKANNWRQESLAEYLKESKELDLQKILNDIDMSSGNDFLVGMNLYPIKKVYDMTMGEWGADSYYFDIMNDTASMLSMKNSLDNGAKDWYLVPVDFHF